ncbi:MAG: DNA-binding protein [Deltaproteobacteria bacterium CG23_combo_of_CG06-09_8_20_14_all_60_8]|nr:MAG: DNA-binding protein [Desulfobacterales bacterium CG2_30_60_27]PIP42780.1 MAG: DNA-binding protein [Deltaproteobacteria bacterium CG23_combo_of_CG06-09_8_20_14_all_60_8]
MTKEVAVGVLLPVESITEKIYHIRKNKVLLDWDLAALYGVETAQLKRAVRRNLDRFPPDFMFVLNQEELENLRCQFGISSWGGTRYPPMAFTEQGVAMLSSVLTSKRAIEVNIAIMRAFVRMREMLAGSKKFAAKLAELEKRLGGHDDNFQIVFQALAQLLHEEDKPKRKIGF